MESKFNPAIIVLLRDNGIRPFREGNLWGYIIAGYPGISSSYTPPRKFQSLLSLAESLIPTMGEEYHAGYRRIHNRYANS